MNRKVIVNVSGGKDSTATLLLALERGEQPIAVFADTGHEHPATYDYVRELAAWTGVTIQWVKADFTAQIASKRKHVSAMWDEPLRSQALSVLHPTGNPFLDLCLVKGRFPSTKIRFCTQELKVAPVNEQVVDVLIEQGADRVERWVGVRADESIARRHLTELEVEFGDPGTGIGIWVVRPILRWTAADVFAYIAKRGAPLNPLYRQGMSRVGCMPCINARKGEIAEISRRFPEEIDRVAEWERLVSLAVKKQGYSVFFPPNTDSAVDPEDTITHETHGIRRVVEWSKTARGGRQTLLDFEPDVHVCSSIYGLCE